MANLPRRARAGATDPPGVRPTILLLHGPNLNLLGTREPGIYGAMTLDEINRGLVARAEGLGLALAVHQSNHEGVLVDLLHAARTTARGVIINAGGLTHTSVVLRDAIAACALPTIEVHLSNTLAREPFRHTTLIGPICAGRVEGFGPLSYELALEGIARIVGGTLRRQGST